MVPVSIGHRGGGAKGMVPPGAPGVEAKPPALVHHKFERVCGRLHPGPRGENHLVEPVGAQPKLHREGGASVQRQAVGQAERERTRGLGQIEGPVGAVGLRRRRDLDRAGALCGGAELYLRRIEGGRCCLGPHERSYSPAVPPQVAAQVHAHHQFVGPLKGRGRPNQHRSARRGAGLDGDRPRAEPQKVHGPNRPGGWQAETHPINGAIRVERNEEVRNGARRACAGRGGKRLRRGPLPIAEGPSGEEQRNDAEKTTHGTENRSDRNPRLVRSGARCPGPSADGTRRLVHRVVGLHGRITSVLYPRAGRLVIILLSPMNHK